MKSFQEGGSSGFKCDIFLGKSGFFFVYFVHEFKGMLSWLKPAVLK